MARKHKHTEACTNTYVQTDTHIWQRGGQGPVLLGLINPQARPRDNKGAREEEGVLPFLMSAIARRTYILIDT